MAGFTNKERARRRMRALGPEVMKVLQVQMRQEAEDLAELMRRRVPVETGTLQQTVRVEDGPRPLTMIIRAGGEPTRKKVRKAVRDGDFAKAKASGGAKGEYDYARSVEFGTSDQTAQPFFYPSYRQKKKGMQRRVKTAAKRGVATAMTK